MCVFAFLPHIYTSSAEERTQQLELVRAVAKEQRANPFVFFWTQASDQQAMQDNLGLSHIFPSLAIYAPGRNKAATYQGAFEKQQLNDFLASLLENRQETFMPGAPVKFKRVEAWDGKDADLEKYHGND